MLWTINVILVITLAIFLFWITFESKSNLPVELITDFELQRPLESGNNTYTFTGKFVEVDNENSLIIISDSSERLYAFKINNYVYRDTDQWLKIYQVASIADLAIGVPIDVRSMVPADTENLLTSLTQVSLTSGDNLKNLGTITVRWNDRRDITKISRDYTNDPNTPINSASPDNIVVAKIK